MTVSVVMACMVGLQAFALPSTVSDCGTECGRPPLRAPAVGDGRMVSGSSESSESSDTGGTSVSNSTDDTESE